MATGDYPIDNRLREFLWPQRVGAKSVLEIHIAPSAKHRTVRLEHDNAGNLLVFGMPVGCTVTFPVDPNTLHEQVMRGEISINAARAKLGFAPIADPANDECREKADLQASLVCHGGPMYPTAALGHVFGGGMISEQDAELVGERARPAPNDNIADAMAHPQGGDGRYVIDE